jgi:hypothetical protein
MEAVRCSCILPFGAVAMPPSLPLPVCLLEVLEVRSSSALGALTSFRSSQGLGAVAEAKLSGR